ncbi:DJ-1/PfpI family protein [Bacillus aquiflavi]|uniref:4-methyl-5(B-hydroxyethyl)-thiazole monophosphate biosynthesis protein n=1 Tax=Bacillus aquiflavi TaxID=2672567 RepID=A0A6B3VZT0_9BACI|nr:DJ-1/PfpI family protein [Bacillus aquiflavi]MBA4536866.1 DJ-1/PfpI family protein [Bacillus aquiflavi]NEY81233.1 4-methyl-5(B-hydroxyethyl)-thiazole monophosphate biosynthesis protein [Bacillus aquiflavi]UAC48459.1 DJ-1/PfpI family protein [Bacillus aquiflavi]
MKITGILLYPRFSEYELSVLLSVLKQGEKEMVTIGLNRELVVGEAGLPCLPHTDIHQVDLANLDSLILPGVDDFAHLVDHQELDNFLQKTAEQQFVYGAISSAPYFLAKSGLLENVKYTTGLTLEQRNFLGHFNEENYVDAPVVTDRHVVTSKGAYFIDFAFKLGSLLNLKFHQDWYR